MPILDAAAMLRNLPNTMGALVSVKILKCQGLVGGLIIVKTETHHHGGHHQPAIGRKKSREGKPPSLRGERRWRRGDVPGSPS